MGAVKKLKERRDHGSVKKALNRVQQAARDGTNLMPEIIYAVTCLATLGEICEVLKKEFGEWREPPTYW